MSRPARPKARSLHFNFKRLKLSQAAVIGFAVGIMFHACVALAVLGSGSSTPSIPAGAQEVNSSQPEATPTATRLPDRTDCNAIRGTDYRSATERQYFLDHCV